MRRLFLSFVVLSAITGCVGLEFHQVAGQSPAESAYSANKQCLPAAEYPMLGVSFGIVGALAQTQTPEWAAAERRYRSCMKAKGWEKAA